MAQGASPGTRCFLNLPAPQGRKNRPAKAAPGHQQKSPRRRPPLSLNVKPLQRNPVTGLVRQPSDSTSLIHTFTASLFLSNFADYFRLPAHTYSMIDEQMTEKQTRTAPPPSPLHGPRFTIHCSPIHSFTHSLLPPLAVFLTTSHYPLTTAFYPTS